MSDTSLSVQAGLALLDGLNLAGGLTLLPHDPVNPPEPSPIDPVVREALTWGLTGGPHPQPWRPAMNLDWRSVRFRIPGYSSRSIRNRCRLYRRGLRSR